MIVEDTEEAELDNNCDDPIGELATFAGALVAVPVINDTDAVEMCTSDFNVENEALIDEVVLLKGLFFCMQ